METTKMYYFYNGYNRMRYRIHITKEQANALYWILDAIDDIEYTLTEVQDDFIDVGKI